MRSVVLNKLVEDHEGVNSDEGVAQSVHVHVHVHVQTNNDCDIEEVHLHHVHSDYLVDDLMNSYWNVTNYRYYL